MNNRFVKEDGPGYAYFGRFFKPDKVRNVAGATELSSELLHPRPTDPNFLVLNERRKILSKWIGQLPKYGLRILDLGGRLQPYRSLVKDRISLYVGTDPVFEGLLDVVGFGEHLPFKDETFNLVICTQALNDRRPAISIRSFSTLKLEHRL